MINIIYIFFNILCVIAFIIIHEFAHALVLKYYKIPFKFGTNIVKTWVKIEEEDFCKIKNVKLYWIAGTISTIAIGLILLLFPIDIKYSIYGMLMGILNIMLIFPGSDSYRLFNIDNFIKWNDNNLHWKGLWYLIGMGISFIISIFVTWKILF